MFDVGHAGAGVSLLLAAPIVALLVLALTTSGDYFLHLASTRLAALALNSLLIGAGSAIVAGIIGVASAWLVTRCDFPGRSFFAGALILPFALPSYVAAYSWYAMTAPGSPSPIHFDGSLPTVAGRGGAVFVFAFTLYPYIYLLARVAFAAHGQQLWEMARSLGSSPHRAFRRVALPIAWPATAAGGALVAMEVLADYGVADFLGVPTMTVGIVRAWSSFGDPAAAAQLAVLLLAASLAALWAERLARGRRRFGSGPGAEGPAPRRMALNAAAASAAIAWCAVPLALGLVLPAANLVLLAMETTPARPIGPAIIGTFQLAAASAGIAALIGLLAAYSLRTGRPLAVRAVRLAQAGYAIPGAVAAVAILALLTAIQSAVGTAVGLGGAALAGGGLFALLYAYQTRFAAVAILPCENALGRIDPSLDKAARSLGATAFGVLRRIHVPLAMPGVAVAALLVGTEVLKELPATMILRPFDLETLAVTAHNYASDERLAQAALPALLLLALSIPAAAALGLVAGRRQ
jgi:iron(III) transport system permease protein